MLKTNQTTVSEPIKFKGVGLHLGKNTELTILPAKSNEGIIFKRTDLKRNNYIKASFLNVTSAKLCTTLENDFGTKVSTVEHLLAAMYLAEIDNAVVEISSEEVPIMDGSAKDFLEKFKKSKIIELSEKRKYLEILSRVELSDGKRKISVEPSNDTFEVQFELKYENKIIGNQKNKINFNKDDIDDVSKSRTFCLYEDIEKIKKAGLAKGGSLDNAIVVDENKVLNKDGLRNEKEFVNHKILDLAGDFLLSGYRVIGKVDCVQGGHALSNQFLRKIFKTESAFTLKQKNEFKFSKEAPLKPLEKIAVNA